MRVQSRDVVNGVTTGIAIAVVCGILFKNWAISIIIGAIAAVAEIAISSFSHRKK